MTADVSSLLAALTGLAQSIAGDDSPEARAAAAGRVTQLEAALAQLDPARTANLDVLRAALASLTAWLRAPGAAQQARAEHALADLQAAFAIAPPDAAADAARRAEIRRDTRAALDAITADGPDLGAGIRAAIADLRKKPSS